LSRIEVDFQLHTTLHVFQTLVANRISNRLPEKKSKSLLELAWLAYNDKVLILLTVAAVVSLALGLYQTFGTPHEPGEAKVEWVEGVAIIVAILIVVIVYVNLGEHFDMAGSLTAQVGLWYQSCNC
jgi:magnesium-transporting ATPase (P-type)